jgi:transcriptional regulator
MSVLHRPERFDTPIAWSAELASKLRFGLLVSHLDGELHFSHLPVIVDVKGEKITCIRGHFARSNPHWRALQQDPRCTFVFNGGNAYMSAQWYSPGCQAAPSWNFITVHVVGAMRLLDTPEQTTEIVDELIRVNEAELPKQWDLAGYSPERRARLTPHILGFALDVQEVQPKFKLLQHYPDEDKVGAIAGLRARGTDDCRQIAEYMERTLGWGSRDMDTAKRLSQQAATAK